jgi:acyl carrier protein
MQLQDSSLKFDEPQTVTNPVEALQMWLIKQLAEQLSHDPSTIKVSEPLTRYGLDSIDAVTLVGDLEDWLDMKLPDTLFWDYPTIAKASQYLAENFDINGALDNLKAEDLTPAVPNNKSSEPVTENKKGWGGLFGRFK